VCRAPCLVSTGRRGIDYTDLFGLSRTLAEGNTRLLLGYIQTGMLANPYYFLRVLIHCVYEHAEKHISELCIANSQRSAYSDKAPINIDNYLQVLPPSIRLNMFSDYPWELIYPDFFDVFSLDQKSRKPFKGYGSVGVQFYDYTKIPGRWSESQRRSVVNHYKLKWRDFSADTYKLPPNYHLTFSFSGVPKSYENQQLAGLAGQASTVVFASSSITSEAIKQAFEIADRSIQGLSYVDVYRKKFKPLITRIRKELLKVFGDQIEAFSVTKTTKQLSSRLLPTDLIPATFDGCRVVSGDLYDLRFLDPKLQTYANEPLVIGLAWKVPKNISLQVGEQEFEFDPATCAILLDEAKDLSYNKTAKLGVGFAVPRYAFGDTFELTIDDVKRCFALFITSENPTQSSTLNLLEKISKVDIENLQIDGVSFNTETGASMNLSDGTQTFYFRMNELVQEPFEGLEIDDNLD